MDIVADLLSGGALVVSILAYRHASTVHRREHRPMVRVVGVWSPQFGVVGHGLSPRVLDERAVLLKNIGRGPALTVVAFDPGRSAILGEVPLVEPLGDGEDEASRIGRVRLSLHGSMTIGSDYELYYQDALGAWHLTKFRPKPGKIECAFVGQVKTVPGEVAPLATVSTP